MRSRTIAAPRPMQIARARVVAEAGPQRRTVVLRGRGKRTRGRESARGSAGSRGSPRYLGLLQHDLRQPDAIGVARVLPRQIVAAVLLLPGDDAGGKAALMRDRRCRVIRDG